MSNNYVVGLVDAKLDNVKIVGKVYTTFATTGKGDHNFPCVLVNGGDCEILNSYISNCASPVRVQSGNLYFENTTLKGGVFCNLDIRGGAHVTINGLTTINQVANNDAADNGTVMIGVGIIVYFEFTNGDEQITILNDSLTQYNWVANNQSSNAITISGNNLISKIFSTADNKFIYTVGSVKWVNTGILSLTQFVGESNITTPSGYEWQNDISMMGQTGNLCTKLASPQQTAGDYSATAQGTIAPDYSFELPTAAGKKNYLAATQTSNNACGYDSTNSRISINVDEGSSFSFDPAILTVTKFGHSITPTVTMNGTDYTGQNISFNASGDYTLTYSYTDSYNYNDATGASTYSKTYTKTVAVRVTVVKASINAAEFTFYPSNNTSGIAGEVATTSNNIKYLTMSGVTGTTANAVGSKTVNGTTIYYPIVFCIHIVNPQNYLYFIIYSSYSIIIIKIFPQKRRYL